MLSKKVSPNDISSLTDDWGKDSANGLPFSGNAVQKFIKENLTSLIAKLVSVFKTTLLEEADYEALTADDMVEGILYCEMEESEEVASATYDTETGMLTIPDATYNTDTGVLTAPTATYDSTMGYLTFQ